LLDQKETKNQGNSPTTICPAKASMNGLLTCWLKAYYALPHTELPKPAALLPTYEKLKY
jgi:hypothetical protein